MTKDVIQYAIYWLNTIPSDNGVYDTLIPSEILQELPNPNYDNITIHFGSYSQVHTGNNKNNKLRAIGDIAPRLDGELNGYYFMSLSTEKELYAFSWTAFPIVDYVMDRAEETERSDIQPTMNNGYPIFEWAPGVPILDGDDYEFANAT